MLKENKHEIFHILGLDELGPEEKSLNNGTHNIDVFKGKF